VLGLPTLSLVLAANQREAAQALSELGAHVALEADAVDDGLPGALAALTADPQAWQAMSAAAATVCDGLGAERTAERFLALVSPRLGNTRATTA